MKSFAEAAQRFTVDPAAVEAFNETHELGLVFDLHEAEPQANTCLSAIENGSLVFVENVRFAADLVDAGLADPTAHSPRTRAKLTPVSVGDRIAENVKYNSLYFRQLYHTDPERYEDLRDQAFDVRHAQTGIFNYAPFYTPLYFGLLDKDCVYVPGDASSKQLPEDVHVQTVSAGISTRQLLDGKLSSDDAYATALRANNDYHDMARYRDVVLVHNMFRLNETRYREALELGPHDVLPTYIVRGSAHRPALASVLDENNINYTVEHFAANPGDPVIGGTWAPNEHSRHEHERRMGVAMKFLAREVNLGTSSVDACVELAGRLEEVGVFAAQSPKELDVVRNLMWRVQAQCETRGIAARFGSLQIRRLARSILSELGPRSLGSD